MEIEKAFKRLLIKSPFYGLFCLSLPKVVTRETDTLCVRKRGITCELDINPDFWEEHTDDEQVALLTHELSHICLQHMFLSSSFSDGTLFNIAADAEVNSYIENLPKSATTAEVLGEKLGISIANGLGTKNYYDILINNRPPQKNNAKNPKKPCNGGKGGSSPSSSGAGGNNNTPQKDEQQNQPKTSEDITQNSTNEKNNEDSPKPQQESEEKQYPEGFEDLKPCDDHKTWKEFQNQPEAVKQLMKNNINSILKTTAEQIQKSRGTIPGELEGIISKLMEKKPEVFNWKAYFRRMLGSIYDVNIKSTRRKASKRFDGAAGIQHKKKVSILVAVDTSGSVSSKELQEFFSEIDYVYKAGANIVIVECDTCITHTDTYDGKNIPKIRGGGGTDFNPPVEYYIKHKKDFASLIYFTDGYAPLPDKNPSNMVWVISSSGCHRDYKGKVIYIPKENN